MSVYDQKMYSDQLPSLSQTVKIWKWWPSVNLKVILDKHQLGTAWDWAKTKLRLRPGKPGPGAAHPADDPPLNKTQAKHYKIRRRLLALEWRGRYNKTRLKCFRENIFPSDKGLRLASMWKNAAAGSLICVDCVRSHWFVQFVPWDLTGFRKDLRPSFRLIKVAVYFFFVINKGAFWLRHCAAFRYYSFYPPFGGRKMKGVNQAWKLMTYFIHYISTRGRALINEPGRALCFLLLNTLGRKGGLYRLSAFLCCSYTAAVILLML